MKRRAFLERTPLVAALAVLTPSMLMAAWNEKDFQKVPLENAFQNVLGTKELVKTDKITIAAPPVAADSSAVPVEVSSSIKGDHLYLFVEKNLTPLVFSCALHAGALPSVALNIKMKESSLLYGVVREGGKCYVASVHVDVSAQAC
ncbi:MAG: thiosulfate-binding protein SoxY [Chlorobi bacterium]|nr:thiosulfate-binding protein SoxY [Chlorobiota bacterium]